MPIPSVRPPADDAAPAEPTTAPTPNPPPAPHADALRTPGERATIPVQIQPPPEARPTRATAAAPAPERGAAPATRRSPLGRDAIAALAIGLIAGATIALGVTHAHRPRVTARPVSAAMNTPPAAPSPPPAAPAPAPRAEPAQSASSAVSAVSSSSSSHHRSRSARTSSASPSAPESAADESSETPATRIDENPPF